MPLSLQEAEVIAAQKAAAIFGREELCHYDGWSSAQNGVFCLSLGKQSDDDITCPIPTIDEKSPGKRSQTFWLI